jgi:hypothetical protein
MSRSRKPANFPKSVNHGLDKYALAATAAGVGILALAQSAEAKIVYTAAHRHIGKNAHYALDLNHDGITDVTFVNSYGCNQDYCFDVLNGNAAAGNGVEGKRGFLSIPFAYALKRGAPIGPGQPFSGQLMASTNVGTLGQWVNIDNGYLGLKFTIKGKIHYGWARLTSHLTSGVIKAVLTGYAYETIANKSIKAGQIKGVDDSSVDTTNASLTAPAPDPATLALLAAGAPGLSVWRREGSALKAD